MSMMGLILKRLMMMMLMLMVFRYGDRLDGVLGLALAGWAAIGLIVTGGHDLETVLTTRPVVASHGTRIATSDTTTS